MVSQILVAADTWPAANKKTIATLLENKP